MPGLGPFSHEKPKGGCKQDQVPDRVGPQVNDGLGRFGHLKGINSHEGGRGGEPVFALRRAGDQRKGAPGAGKGGRRHGLRKIFLGKMVASAPGRRRGAPGSVREPPFLWEAPLGQPGLKNPLLPSAFSFSIFLDLAAQPLNRPPPVLRLVGFVEERLDQAALGVAREGSLDRTGILGCQGLTGGRERHIVGIDRI